MIVCTNTATKENDYPNCWRYNSCNPNKTPLTEDIFIGDDLLACLYRRQGSLSLVVSTSTKRVDCFRRPISNLIKLDVDANEPRQIHAVENIFRHCLASESWYNDSNDILNQAMEMICGGENADKNHIITDEDVAVFLKKCDQLQSNSVAEALSDDKLWGYGFPFNDFGTRLKMSECIHDLCTGKSNCLVAIVNYISPDKICRKLLGNSGNQAKMVVFSKIVNAASVKIDLPQSACNQPDTDNHFIIILDSLINENGKRLLLFFFVAGLMFAGIFLMRGALRTYNIVVSHGNATIDGKVVERVKKGKFVIVTANEPDGWKFREWECKGCSIPDEQKNQKTLKFEMPGNDIELVAQLSPVKYSVTVSHGKATINGKVVEKVEKGKIIIITAQVPDGLQFREWECKGCSIPDEQKNQKTLKLEMPGNDIEVIVKFIK